MQTVDYNLVVCQLVIEWQWQLK